MSEAEEGMNFAQAFMGQFAAKEGTQRRLKSERRAGLTAKQRKKGPPKQQVNFRASAKTIALIDALTAHLDQSKTDVLEQAVQALAKALPNFKGAKK